MLFCSETSLKQWLLESELALEENKLFVTKRAEKIVVLLKATSSK